MRRVVRCICILLTLGFVFTACTDKSLLEKELLEKENTISSAVIKNSISENNFERYDLLMTKYINDTKVYGISVSNGIYDKIQVEISDNKKEFDWRSLGDDEYLPFITYGDVNNDEVNECIIILSDDYNGNIIQTPHVLNPESLEEIQIESVKDFISSKITTKTENDLCNVLLDELVVHTFNLEEIKDDNEVDVEEKKENEEIEQDTISNEEKIDYEHILDFIDYDNITYKINGNLFSSVVVFKLNEEELNTITISYEYKEEMLKCKLK